MRIIGPTISYFFRGYAAWENPGNASVDHKFRRIWERASTIAQRPMHRKGAPFAYIFLRIPINPTLPTFAP